MIGRTDNGSPNTPTFDVSVGVTLKSKPVRKLGRIVAQHVIRQLPDGTLESATYPLYALAVLDVERGAA